MEAVDATPVFISIPQVVMEQVFESLGPSQELPLAINWEEEDCVPHWYGHLVFGWKMRRRLALSCKACHTASRHWKCFIRLGVPKAYLRSPERNEVEDVQQLALAELARARLWAPEAPLWKCCMTARPKNGHPGDMSLVEFDCIHPLYRIREFCRPGGRLWRTKDNIERQAARKAQWAQQEKEKEERTAPQQHTQAPQQQQIKQEQQEEGADSSGTDTGTMSDVVSGSGTDTGSGSDDYQSDDSDQLGCVAPSDEVEDQYKYVNMFDDTCRLMFVIGELAIRDQQAIWC